MRLLGYIRDSSNPEYSVETQRFGITAWANANYNSDNIQFFEDDTAWGSINIFDRPGGSELYDEAREGDIILGYTLDRCFSSLQQATITIDDLQDRNIIFNIVSLGYKLEEETGQLIYETCKQWVSFDSFIKSERVKQSRELSGRPTNNCTPIGFKKVRYEKQSYFVPDEDERLRILDLIKWRDRDGETWSECVRRMQKKKRANGHKWNQTNVRVAYQAGLDGFPGSEGQKDGFTILEQKRQESKKKRAARRGKK